MCKNKFRSVNVPTVMANECVTSIFVEDDDIFKIKSFKRGKQQQKKRKSN